MSEIGFELCSKQALSILPGYTFSLSISQGKKRLVSSIGKDVYHLDGLILPDRRICATGRIHNLSAKNINPYEPLQTSACLPITYSKKNSQNFVVELSTPSKDLKEQLKQTTYLYLVIHDETDKKRIPLFLDPNAFLTITPTQFQLDVSIIIKKHL